MNKIKLGSVIVFAMIGMGCGDDEPCLGDEVSSSSQALVTEEPPGE